MKTDRDKVCIQGQLVITESQNRQSVNVQINKVCIQVSTHRTLARSSQGVNTEKSKVCIQFALFACEVLKTKGVYSV